MRSKQSDAITIATGQVVQCRVYHACFESAIFSVTVELHPDRILDLSRWVRKSVLGSQKGLPDRHLGVHHVVDSWVKLDPKASPENMRSLHQLNVEHHGNMPMRRWANGYRCPPWANRFSNPLRSQNCRKTLSDFSMLQASFLVLSFVNIDPLAGHHNLSLCKKIGLLLTNNGNGRSERFKLSIPSSCSRKSFLYFRGCTVEIDTFENFLTWYVIFPNSLGYKTCEGLTCFFSCHVQLCFQHAWNVLEETKVNHQDSAWDSAKPSRQELGPLQSVLQILKLGIPFWRALRQLLFCPPVHQG